MNFLKNWLGITALEKRQTGMEDVINHVIVHLTEVRETADKISAIVLTYQPPTVEVKAQEAPVAKAKPKPKKKPNGK